MKRRLNPASHKMNKRDRDNVKAAARKCQWIIDTRSFRFVTVEERAALLLVAGFADKYGPRFADQVPRPPKPPTARAPGRQPQIPRPPTRPGDHPIPARPPDHTEALIVKSA